MKLRLRCISGLFSLMGLGYFIYYGSTNYIVLSVIMFSFSAFVITFANFVINKNYDLNMYEKHGDTATNNKDSTGGYLLTKRDCTVMIIAILLMCGASFLAGRVSTAHTPIGITQQQTITITNEDKDNLIELVNINTADKEELKLLEGIGESKAVAIINNRPYDSIYQLLSFKIIGQETFENIREVITCE